MLGLNSDWYPHSGAVAIFNHYCIISAYFCKHKSIKEKGRPSGRKKRKKSQSISPGETETTDNGLRLKRHLRKTLVKPLWSIPLHSIGMHCSSLILHEKCGTKWTTKSSQCTHAIQAWQQWRDLHFAMTIHKILSLLISKMEQFSTANSGFFDNRCVSTTVIS